MNTVPGKQITTTNKNLCQSSVRFLRIVKNKQSELK